MRVRTEIWAFRGLVGLTLIIPLIAGLVGAFGGVAGMASLFGVESQTVLSPLLRNNFRAVCFMFFAWVPLVIWTLRDLPGRAGGVSHRLRVCVPGGARSVDGLGGRRLPRPGPVGLPHP
jgi:hypothetical protein